MSDYIILTSTEAGAVRGLTKSDPRDRHALDPIETATVDEFVLPVRVLSDPAHNIRKGALEVRPQKITADIIFKVV